MGQFQSIWIDKTKKLPCYTSSCKNERKQENMAVYC